MLHIRGGLRLLSLLLLLLSILIPLILVKADKAEECHKTHDDKNLASPATLQDINNQLQQLYGVVKTDAEHEENCTYTLELDTDKDTDESIHQFTLVHIFEAFETRRDNYENGLWGYCSKEGAKDLIKSIKGLKQKILNDNAENLALPEDERRKPDNVTICNRDKFLGCHQEYRKCQCLDDYRNFRNIESEWWDATDPDNMEKDPKKRITTSQCILKEGSDCPIDYKFLCIPGTRCLFKKTLKPCANKYLKKALGKDAVGPVYDANPGYSTIRQDYPSIYCQCIGFNKQGAGRTSQYLGLGTLIASLAFSRFSSSIFQ